MPRKWKAKLRGKELEELREVTAEAVSRWLRDHPHTPPDLRKIAQQLYDLAEQYDEHGAEWAMSVGPDE